MSVEDASHNLQNLDHDFYLFRSLDTGDLQARLPCALRYSLARLAGQT